MAVTLAVGTTPSIASTYGTAVVMSAITNATEAVATLGAGHGVVAGDFLEITSGWSLLDGRVVRAKTVATNDVTLELVNTVSTTNYPAGSGTGTIRRITAWTAITQVTSELQTSGGDQEFADVTTLQDRTKRQIPTRRSPVELTMPVYFDNSLGWVSTVRAAADTATATAVRLVYPNGSRTVGNAYWSMSDVPQINDSTLRANVSLTFSALPITYST
jgi:Phage tail tube protein, TTP